MNRREGLGGGGRNGAAGSASVIPQYRPRVGAAALGTRDGGGGEELDLFSRNRRSLPASSDDDSDGQIGRPKLGSMPPESPKVLRSGVDDILSGVDIGKHDYDWLLTPPGTPLSSVMNARDHEQSPAPLIITSSLAKPVVTAKASRFSVSQTENSHSTRPARSSSLTRPSISSGYSGHFSSNNKTSVLNTSMSSVTSYRPSTPTRRPTTASKQASSVPASRTSSRPSTPAKTRPSQSSIVGRAPTSTDRSRPLHGSRPSTPTTRPQISASLNSSASSVATRPISRPSTPTRRTVAHSTPTPLASKRPSTPVRPSARARPSAPTRPATPTRRTATPSTSIPVRSTSVGRVPAANGRNSGPPSRPSSPSPRVRTPAQSIALTDFTLNAPPNLRTKLPERPVSAGRTRSGSASTSRANMNSDASSAPANSTRRKSSPIVSRGRLPDNSLKTQLQINGHEATPPETQKVLDGTIRKLAKPATTTESTGFGRNISKKSLDMALRHMDIRQGIRGASLFPQSIRSAASKGRPGRMSDPVTPFSRNGTDTENNDCGISILGSYNGAISENDSNGIAMSPDRDIMKRVTAPDIYESTRYDTILLKEDSKNMNWLHSIEDKSDQSPVFDHRFEPLPEPFALP